MNVRIGDDEHVAVFGRTGSGKTYRSLSLLDHVPRWVIVDPKWGIDGARYPRVPYRQKFDGRAPRQVLRPPLSLVGDPLEYAWYEAQITRAFLAGGPRVVYVDEVANISRNTQRLNRGFDRVLRLGRQRRVTGWSGTQRPALIPSNVFTEASHFFVFRLTYDRDREKVASFTDGRVIDLLRQLRGHDCVYWSVYLDDPVIIPSNAIDISSVRIDNSVRSARAWSWPSWLRRS